MGNELEYIGQSSRYAAQQRSKIVQEILESIKTKTDLSKVTIPSALSSVYTMAMMVASHPTIMSIQLEYMLSLAISDPLRFKEEYMDRLITKEVANKLHGIGETGNASDKAIETMTAIRAALAEMDDATGGNDEKPTVDADDSGS